jgi:exodeoxyribonuclease VII small subunit
MKFEDNMKSLEDILKKLENGELSLEENAKLYTQGVKLVASCRKELENTKLKVGYNNEC